MTAVLGDVDHDLDLDLVLANGDGPTLLLLGDGQGRFARAPASQLPAQHQVSMSTALGDLDRDGDLDLVVANRASQNRVWINDGNGVFTDETAARLPKDTDGSYDVVLADIDANGTLDLFVINKFAPHKLYLNNGLGLFTEVNNSHLPQERHNGISGLPADVDADGDLDLLVAAGTSPLRLWLNDGTGHFTDHTATHIPTLNAYGLKVRAGDVDGDGTLDLVLAAAGQDQVLYNDGTGRFLDATTNFAPQDDRRSFGLALLDADADLALDVLLGTPQGSNRFWRNVLTLPRLYLAASPAYKAIGTPVTVTVEAFDENGLATAVLTLTDPQGHPQTVDLVADLSDRSATYTFAPALPGTYLTAVTVTDTQGERTTRRLPLQVVVPDTTAPQVDLVVDAPTPTRVGHPMTLRVTVSDLQPIVATTASVNGTPVALDSAGVGTYVPTTAGDYAVIATATDSAGNIGTTQTTVRVEADTTPPVVTLTVSPGVVELAQPMSITVSTTDNVAVTTRTLRITGPAIPEDLTLPLDAAGNATYTPFQPGTYTLTATASDPSGQVGTATTSLTITGLPDTTPPVVSLAVTPTTVRHGTPVTITLAATDNVAVIETVFEINDTPQPLPTSGVTTYTPPVVGTYTVSLVARDAFGNSDSALVTFRAITPEDDTTPPMIAIASPEPDAELTASTDIIGTVHDETLVRYTLAYSPHGEDRFTIFATGTSEVTDGVLGTLDTSLLLNDLYDIRLTAEDANG